MKNIQCKSASVVWKEGVIPFSEEFQDSYFSTDGGLEESNFVFIRGNELNRRLVPGFKIAELGFGTGLNLLALIRLWSTLGHLGKIHFTSFEAFPIKIDDMKRALSSFPELIGLSENLCSIVEGGVTNFEIENVEVKLIYGDARDKIKRWNDKANAWFLDGFAPIKNPQLWEYDLLSIVADKTVKGGTFATYTASGSVRRNLSQLGFNVAKVNGFGKKRHMLLGKKID